MDFRLNRRRRRSRGSASTRPGRLRAFVLGTAALVAVAGAVVLVPALPVQADPGKARAELTRALKLFEGGATSDAKQAARAAVRADPNWGLAHAVLARMFLELEDGVAAQAELDRATAAGFDAKRAIQLYAHAYLLQGDVERAIATSWQALPAYQAYAARVRGRALAVQGDTIGGWATLSQVVNYNSHDSRAWSDIGRLHLDAGDLHAATVATNRALREDPRNVDALVLRGELVRGQFGLVAALPWFEAALKRDPWDHNALIEYAGTLGEAGRYSDMLRAARKALEAKPGSAQAYFLQAMLAARAGDDDTARAMLERIGPRLDGMPAALLLAGGLDYGAGAWQQAIGHWGNLVGMQPKNIVARRLLASALLRAGDQRGALDVLRPVALRDDADSYTLSLVARAFEKRGERDWAARFLDRAMLPGTETATPFGVDQTLDVLERQAARVKTPANFIEVVRGLVAAQDYDAALARAKLLVKQNPGAPAARVLVGDVYAQQKNWPQAVTWYRQAADLRFDEPTALRLVDAYDRGGAKAQAADTLALFLSQNPANVAALRLTAHWQIAQGQWDAAIATLESLRARVGNRDAALLAELAFAYLGKGDADGAEVYAAAAYRLAPSNPAAADAWGMALLRLGDAERAGQLLEKAASLAPRVSTLRWHLAQAYVELKRPQDARMQARVALLDPTFAERAAAEAVVRDPTA